LGRQGGRAGPKRIRRSLAEYFAGERIPHPEEREASLIYDALLALRGWGERDFRYVSPRFMSTIRHALFAESGVKMLQETEQIAHIPVARGMDPKAQADLLRAKLPAQADAQRLRALLFPEGD
jgi:hypothetical protein